MDKKLKGGCGIIGIIFLIRSIIYFVGKSTVVEGEKVFFWGNEVFADIGDQLFRVGCFLVIFYLVVTFLYDVIEKFAKNIGKSVEMRNYFLFLTVVAFVTGIVLLGGGMAAACLQVENLLAVCVLAAGILLEIAAMCFGFIYHQLVKQITSVHRPLYDREGADLQTETGKNKERLF